jgi:hypothetical protein
MNCPKCGTQNPQDVQVCTSCGSELTQPPEVTESVNVKTSSLAIASLLLGILSICIFYLAAAEKSDIIAFISCGLAISALVLGIISLIRIGLSAGRITGKGIAVTGIMIPVLLYTTLIIITLKHRPRSIAYRMVCGSKLSGIGRAMLIYANDYDNNFPRAGGRGTIWQPKLNNWQADNRSDAFSLKSDGTVGSATISSSLYLLVKYVEVTPKSFCCKQDPRIRAFKASDYTSGMDDEDAWDFGPEPTKHCSYSYHMCYGPYPLSIATSEPGQAVAADRNPWLDP